MKTILLIFCLSFIFLGCANDAYYADREFGIASGDAFDRQIAHKDYIYANKPVEGMAGIHAEPTMEMYHDSFGKGFTQESIEVLNPQEFQD